MLKQLSIFFFLFPHFLFCQTLKGIVADKSNQPIEAVNVSVMGKQIGTSTNEMGVYKLQLKENRSYLDKH